MTMSNIDILIAVLAYLVLAINGAVAHFQIDKLKSRLDKLEGEKMTP